ncbi:hypothetical protein DPMN_138232 [Dreissena polymorpha]|uniref:Uncharacterized protein n=1 Tax=Dreissena polymorpha TaxID=45954 RepID=A0A9D4G9D8_DREPO|nr:hypothetical protein DPMN_138232 [Dreissena polymorpha]
MLLKILRFEDALQKFDKKFTDIFGTFYNNDRKWNGETKTTVDEAKLKMKQVLEEIKQTLQGC